MNRAPVRARNVPIRAPARAGSISTGARARVGSVPSRLPARARSVPIRAPARAGCEVAILDWRQLKYSEQHLDRWRVTSCAKRSAGSCDGNTFKYGHCHYIVDGSGGACRSCAGKFFSTPPRRRRPYIRKRSSLRGAGVKTSTAKKKSRRHTSFFDNWPVASLIRTYYCSFARFSPQLKGLQA